MAVDIRSITEDVLQTYIDASARGFGGDMLEGEHERVREVIGLDRCHVAVANERVVGTIGSYSFPLAMPGTVDIPAAGLTRVTVAATHRRQGVLTAMMANHFQDAIDHDEAVSILWASEAPIYGRYGYGQATENVAVSFDNRITTISRPEVPDQLDIIDGTEAEEILPSIREQTRVSRPGKFGRSELWWTHRSTPDPEGLRRGLSKRRYVVARRGNQDVGYVTFRQKENWGDDDLPNGEVNIIELNGIDQQAEHTLWWHVGNIDLFPNVVSWNQPADSLLPWLASNPRGIGRRFSDGIHARVIDVEKTFSTRRYQSQADLVFSLTDERLPKTEGTYHLSIDDAGVGTCARTDAAPDIAFDAYALGALCLGHTRPEPLAAIGHIRSTSGEPGGISPAQLKNLRDTFGWPVAAWCDEMF